MYTITTFDYDCTKKCKKIEHGNAITAALTKRSISTEKLARYISKVCRNFAEILDEEGRSALHLAVSVGNRYDIVEYLLKQGAAINLKDKESGQTAITRAILYGNLAEAVLLAKNGALLMPDNDFINPLQYCYRVKKPIDNENRCETFVWGKNKNYNIGIGNVQEKTSPDYLDAFRKSKIFIQQVSMNSYHTLFLSDDGELFATGHGKGGRLGSSDELTLVSPKRVRILFKEEHEKIISISAGKNHSLVLTNKNRVFVTGSNSHGQLGLKSCPEMLMSFTELPSNFSEAKRVIANDYSSLVVTNANIYAFGTNIGQFGLKKDVDKVVTPRKITTNTERAPLDIVESTNSALLFYSSSSALLHLLYKYETKIYKKPLMERITQISANGGLIVEGHKNCQRQDRPLRFIVLTEFHNVFIWYETTEKFVKCSFTACRYLEIDKIIWSNDEILLSYLGNLYKGTATHEVKHKTIHIPGEYQETYVKRELSSDQKTKIELKRISFIDKIIDFSSDPEGENFIALVENPRKYFSLPEFIEKLYDYSNLYASVNECDSIHDVTFELGGRRFPVHRIIIFHRSDYLKTIIEQNPEEKIIQLHELSDLGLPCDIFDLILRYIYTNQPIMKTEVERVTVDYHQTLTMLKKVLTLMGFNELITALKKNSQKCKTPFKPLTHTNFPELYDVTLKLDCEQEIHAHKCILMSRLEYFNMMFEHTWAEEDTVSLTSISIEYMQPIIDFLYSNGIDEVRKGSFTDNYMYNMITICDQFFVEDLKNIFELMASEKISVKNCGEILEFADAYNCETLRNCCMQFISLNFSRVLELRSLETTDPKVVQQVNKFYRQFFSLVSYWTITPYANAISDEELEQFIVDFTVNLKGSQEEEGVKQKQKNKVAKPSKTSLDKRSYEKGGIIAMQKESKEVVQRNEKGFDSKQQEFIEEMNQISEKFESVAKMWTKVNDKKDAKKKQQSVLTALKVNEVLKSESKTENSFTNLKQTPPKKQESPTSRCERTPEPSTSKNTTPAVDQSPRTKLTFTIADITPLKMKSSHKNRKRLSSGSTDARNPFQETSSQDVLSPQTPPNPWKTLPSTSIKSPLSSDSSPGSSKSPTVTKTPLHNLKSLQSIIENEQKQKQYFEKIKTKSLALTQLEEKAIEELMEFYNVDNIFDETIIIERRHVTCDDTQVQCVKWYQDKK